MQPYQPMAVELTAALELLKSHPPHRDLHAFHSQLLVGMEQVLRAEAPSDLAGRLLDWFALAADPSAGAPERGRYRSPNPQGLDLPWQLLAAVAGELPELEGAAVGAAMEVVERARAERPGPGVEALGELLREAWALHRLAAQGTLSAAELRLCLALGSFSADPRAARFKAYAEWKGTTQAGPAELLSLARRLAPAEATSPLRRGTHGERARVTLCWRLGELASALQEPDEPEVLFPGGAP